MNGGGCHYTGPSAFAGASSGCHQQGMEQVNGLRGWWSSNMTEPEWECRRLLDTDEEFDVPNDSSSFRSLHLFCPIERNILEPPVLNHWEIQCSILNTTVLISVSRVLDRCKSNRLLLPKTDWEYTEEMCWKRVNCSQTVNTCQHPLTVISTLFLIISLMGPLILLTRGKLPSWFSNWSIIMTEMLFPKAIHCPHSRDERMQGVYVCRLQHVHTGGSLPFWFKCVFQPSGVYCNPF